MPLGSQPLCTSSHRRGLGQEAKPKSGMVLLRDSGDEMHLEFEWQENQVSLSLDHMGDSMSLK